VSDQAVGTVGGDRDSPSWDLYREMADNPRVSPARRQATRWALDQLAQRMGSDWLERYWTATGHVPEEVNLGAAHVGALGSLLELALRFYLLDGVHGLGSVQREMKRDLRDDRRRHAALQLDVAGIAGRAGFAVALEERSGARIPPSDVVLRRGVGALRVETFAIITDERFRMAQAYWDWLMAQIRRISWQYDVEIDGDTGDRLDDAASAELLQLIEATARTVADTRNEQPVIYRGAALRVLPSGTSDSELRGAVETSQAWPRIQARLMQKATQAARAGGGWLRADLMDGTWQFTPWARAGLRAKLDQIAALLQQTLGQIDGIDGIVVSSGACLAQGQFHGESARTADHCYGFVRPLPAVRVRETMIIPARPQARDQADIWASLYNAEDSWLDWALGQAGLPDCRQIFRR
jgi:hypothetical protein